MKAGVIMKESKFTGGLLGLIGISILKWLITFFTLGIAYPWGVVIKERWLAEHTTIDGKRLTFNGTGGGLFGQYIKWLLLSIVTIGIYLLWLNIKMKQWVTKHTHFL